MQAGGHSDQGGSAASHAGGVYRTMRSMRGAHTLGEINVTPLVDVVLVLLIVFMVTAPMMSRGIDVSLPVANQPDIAPQDRLTVTLNHDGRIFIGDRPVNIVLLEDQVRGRLQGSASKVVYLSADERINYGKVVQVIDILKRAGVEQFGLTYVLPEQKEGR
jgi:biopolymer transport protein ExbD